MRQLLLGLPEGELREVGRHVITMLDMGSTLEVDKVLSMLDNAEARERSDETAMAAWLPQGCQRPQKAANSQYKQKGLRRKTSFTCSLC